MWNWESRLPDLLSEEMSQLDLHKSSGKCVTFAPEVAQVGYTHCTIALYV